MGTVSQYLIFCLIFVGSVSSLQFVQRSNNSTDDEDSQSLYCFVNPPERTSFDPNILANISCTHFVYGSIPIDNQRGKPEFSNWDVLYAGRDGNIRRFLRLRSIHRHAKFLLGVRRTSPFRDIIDANNVAKGVKKAYIEKRFDGVFVTFDGIHLQQPSSTAFMKELASNEKMMKPVFGVTALRVWQFEAVDRIRQMLDYIEHLYVDMSTLPSNEDPYIITNVDPLLATGHINFEDTIQGTVDKLAEEGIMPNKIIVGLTAGGWKFTVPNVMKIAHSDFATERGERIPYQDACKARGSVVFDNGTLNEITLYRQTWITSNFPTREAMGKKMQWALLERYAGIGISSIYNDDPAGLCGTDPLPAHTLAVQILKGTIPSIAAKCNRLCYLKPEEIDDSFPFDSLKSEYCSHLVIDYIGLDIQKLTVVSDEADIILEKLEQWRRKIGDVAPKLILSIGSHQKSTEWSFLLSTEAKRKELIDEILKIVDSKKVDGIEISWTLETMNGDLDKKLLNSFIEEMNSSDLNHEIETIIAVTAESTFSQNYDVDFFNKTVDFVVLHTHRLHSDKTPFTGHPSPLRATSSMQNQKMSLEEVVKYWTSNGMDRRRIIVSLSASAITMTSLADQKSSAVLSSPFGQPAFVSVLRSNKMDIKTQQAICESIKMGSAEPKWVSVAEVPYFMRDSQFVSYENTRSARIKAVWASIEGLGLAIHDLGSDDPHAVCDNRTAFPILSELTRAHVCPKCITPHNFRKCGHNFIVSCSFDLKKDSPIFKTDIVPYERCTEVVVEQAKLNETGTVIFHNAEHENVVKNLTLSRAKMGKCGMVLSLSCGISERVLTGLLLENMTTVIDNIMETLEKYNFSGVKLDCEKVVRRNNNIQFNTFMKKLNDKLAEKKAANGCERTLAMRFSTFTKSPSSLYRISELNKIHHISLSMTDKHHLDHQFFANGSEHPSAELLLSTWLLSGVKPSNLVLELSPYARHTINSKTNSLSQGKVCETAGNRADFIDNFNDLNASYNHTSGLIDTPTYSTFRYKLGFLLREELGGVGFRSVNGDDYTGICGRGSFPILKTIYGKDKCY